jgi:hypothetical protein
MGPPWIYFRSARQHGHPAVVSHGYGAADTHDSSTSGFGVGVISSEDFKRNTLGAGGLAPNDGPLPISASAGLRDGTTERFTRGFDKDAPRVHKAAHSGPTGNVGCILSAGG